MSEAKRRFYHNAPARVTECHDCGETRMCEVLVADSPESETGYVDEYAICEECKNYDPRNEPFGPTDIFGNDWHKPEVQRAGFATFRTQREAEHYLQLLDGCSGRSYKTETHKWAVSWRRA